MCNLMSSLVQSLLFFIGLVAKVKSQVDLEEYFGNCKIGSPDFDDCVKDGINGLRPYFNEGLPEYGIEPFDPFFAKEVHQKNSNPLFSYKLVLRNVTESGWTSSQVTKFKTDYPKSTVHVTQFFPDKRLNGWYEIEGTFFGQKIKNSGSWNLELYDYIQTLSENMLDWVINTAWQPGFYVLSPLINGLVGTAFTEILNKDFQYFPFDSVFHR